MASCYFFDVDNVFEMNRVVEGRDTSLGEEQVEGIGYVDQGTIVCDIG